MTEPSMVVARRLWRAVTAAFVVFAAGLVVTLGLLFSAVTITAPNPAASEHCGSPVNALFLPTSEVHTFGVPDRDSLPSCDGRLTRRTAVAITILLFAAVPLAIALLWTLWWHLQGLTLLRRTA